MRSFYQIILLKKSIKTCEYQTDEFDNNLIDKSHEECSYPLPPPPLAPWLTWLTIKIHIANLNMMKGQRYSNPVKII